MQSICCVHCAHSTKKKRNLPRKPQKVKRAPKRLTHRKLRQSLVAGFDGTVSGLRLAFAEAKLRAQIKEQVVSARVSLLLLL